MNELFVLKLALENCPVIHTALLLFLLSGIVLSAGLLMARLCGRGPLWNSFAMRSLLAVTLMLCCMCLLSALDLSGKNAIVTERSEPLPLPFNVIIHPSSLPDSAFYNNERLLAQDSGPQHLSLSHFTDGQTPLSMDLPISASGAVGWISRSADRMFALIWLGFFLVTIGRQVAGRIQIARLLRQSEKIAHGEIADVARRFADRLELGGSRSPAIVSCSKIVSPFVSGIVRQTIFLPITFIQQSSREEIETALVHEMEHIRRKDTVVSLLADSLCALVWFQPLVWMLRRELELFAEQSCDQKVLLTCDGAGPSYANLLLCIAESRTNPFTERIAGIGLAPTPSAIGRRIKAILGGIDLNLARLSKGQRIVFSSFLLVSAFAVSFVFAVRYVPATAAQASTTDSSQLVNSWEPPARYADQFILAKQQHWTVSPVQTSDSTTNAGRIFGQSNSVPLADQAIIKQCLQASGLDGASAHLLALQAIIDQHPKFFYAEYTMSTQEALAGHAADARIWLLRSLCDAPTVIAGRVQMSNGRPVTGFIGNTALYYYSHWGVDVNNYDLPFPYFRTDSSGCYYLPAYRGITGQFEWGYNNEQPTPSALLVSKMTVIQPGDQNQLFTSSSKVGLVPPYIAYTPLPISVAGHSARFADSSAPGSDLHSIQISGKNLTIKWGSSPGATRYYVNMTEQVPNGDFASYQPSLTDGNPLFEQGTAGTSFTTTFDAQPCFLSGRLYEIDIAARDAKYGIVNRSVPFYFTVVNRPRSLRLNQQNISKFLDPSVKDFDLSVKPTETEIRFLSDDEVNHSVLDTAFDRNVFGIGRQSIGTSWHSSSATKRVTGLHYISHSVSENANRAQ